MSGPILVGCGPLHFVGKIRLSLICWHCALPGRSFHFRRGSSLYTVKPIFSVRPWKKRRTSWTRARKNGRRKSQKKKKNWRAKSRTSWRRLRASAAWLRENKNEQKKVPLNFWSCGSRDAPARRRWITTENYRVNCASATWSWRGLGGSWKCSEKRAGKVELFFKFWQYWQ